MRGPSPLDGLGPAIPALEEIFGRLAADGRVPGLCWGVIAGGGLVHHGALGLANIEAGLAPSPSTVFRIASMTKSFTAMCVLCLRDEGALALDDPVARWVPELVALRPPSADAPPLTLRLLLSMSAGWVEDDAWADRQLDLDEDAFSGLLGAGLGFDLDPGTGYEYSNLGYAILGRVVAAASGVPLWELSRQRLLAPLGMDATTWNADAVGAGRAAVGYRLQGGDFVPEPVLGDGAFAAMGGLCSTLQDLARYVSFHLSAWPARDEPEMGPLRRSSIREMTHATAFRKLVTPDQPTPDQPTPDQPTPDQPTRGPARSEGYGFGLVAGVLADGTRTVGHSGGLPGFGSHMEWLPDHGIGVVALANRTYAPAAAAVREAMTALLGSGAASRREIPASPALLAAQAAVRHCYEQGDPDVLACAALETFFLDLDEDRRPPDLAALRAAHGACRSEEPLVATGRLRGSWLMRCERGALEVTVTLGPSLPGRIQFLTVRELPDGPANPA